MTTGRSLYLNAPEVVTTGQSLYLNAGGCDKCSSVNRQSPYLNRPEVVTNCKLNAPEEVTLNGGSYIVGLLALF